MFNIGDKVLSLISNKTYDVKTHNDRYKIINVHYVNEHPTDFIKVG